jgi:hypothetical protein
LLSLSIDGPAVRGFMNRLLREELFDAFEVRGVELCALTRVDISGVPETEKASDPPPLNAFVTWARLRPVGTAVIKSSQMPRSMKVVFSMDTETAAGLHPNAAALFLNLTYENGGAHFTAATSQKQFALDKSLDEKWEEYIQQFFKRHEIKVIINQ